MLSENCTVIAGAAVQEEGGDSGSHTSQGDRHLTTQPHTWLSDLQGPTAVHFADVILSKALVHS